MNPKLTQAEIEKQVGLAGANGPWGDREWLAALLDLQQARQDLLDFYLLSTGDTPEALRAFRGRLKQQYGWEES